MFKGTTPTIRWVIKNEDIAFEDIEKVWMTFCDCSNYKITKDEMELLIDEKTRSISYEFSQEETLKFKIGMIQVQMRILMNDGKAFATRKCEFPLEDILKGGVIQ